MCPHFSSSFCSHLSEADYQMTGMGLARTLQLAADGSICATGGLVDDAGRFRGFVARISADGDLLWFREPLLVTNVPMWAFSSLAVGAHGTLCAGGSFAQAIFSSDGELLRYGMASEVAPPPRVSRASPPPESLFTSSGSRARILPRCCDGQVGQ